MDGLEIKHNTNNDYQLDVPITKESGVEQLKNNGNWLKGKIFGKETASKTEHPVGDDKKPADKDKDYVWDEKFEQETERVVNMKVSDPTLDTDSLT